jgi:hypothetical protein
VPTHGVALDRIRGSAPGTYTEPSLCLRNQALQQPRAASHKGSTAHRASLATWRSRRNRPAPSRYRPPGSSAAGPESRPLCLTPRRRFCARVRARGKIRPRYNDPGHPLRGGRSPSAMRTAARHSDPCRSPTSTSSRRPCPSSTTSSARCSTRSRRPRSSGGSTAASSPRMGASPAGGPGRLRLRGGTFRSTLRLRTSARRATPLAQASVRLRPGEQRTVRVRLTEAGRRLLKPRRRRTLRATARLAVRYQPVSGATQNRVFSRRVPLRGSRR